MKLNSFIKASLLSGGMLFILSANAQELYVFSEPASNMPTRSIGGKVSGKFVRNHHRDGFMQRYTPEVMFGLSKKWMVHFAPTFSDMYSSNLRWESARIYGKYRFLSKDDVHKHFRMAAFGELSHSRNKLYFDELSIDGDQSGFMGGLIMTQLWNRLAISSTVGYVQVSSDKPIDIVGESPDKALNYSFSGGYLVFPLNYTSFRQTNFNIYAELLGQRSLDMKRYFVDLAPAVQLIFNSNAKVNTGYRFQLNGNMRRMAENSWLVSFERTFLGAW